MSNTIYEDSDYQLNTEKSKGCARHVKLVLHNKRTNKKAEMDFIGKRKVLDTLRPGEDVFDSLIKETQ